MTGLVIFCALALAAYGWLKEPAVARVAVVDDGMLAFDAYYAAKANGLEV